MNATFTGTDLSDFSGRGRDPHAIWDTPDNLIKATETDVSKGDHAITAVASKILGEAGKFFGKAKRWARGAREGKNIAEEGAGVEEDVASEDNAAKKTGLDGEKDSKTPKSITGEDVEHLPKPGASAAKEAMTTSEAAIDTAAKDGKALEAAAETAKVTEDASKGVSVMSRIGGGALKGAAWAGKGALAAADAIPLLGEGVIAVSASFHDGKFDPARGLAAGTGAFIGGLGGGATGAAVGSVVPGAGTLVGGIAGEALGQMGGGAAAAKVYDMAHSSSKSSNRPFAQVMQSVTSSPVKPDDHEPSLDGPSTQATQVHLGQKHHLQTAPTL